MEYERIYDGLLSASHDPPTLPILTETNHGLLQLLQRTELEAMLKELDELIKSERGLLIP
jgi:hypothetical protein